MKLWSWVAKRCWFIKYYFVFILAFIHSDIRLSFFEQECIFLQEGIKTECSFLIKYQISSIKTLSAFEACVSIMWLYMESTSKCFFLSRKISMVLETRGLNVDNNESWLSFSLLFISLIKLWFNDKLLKAVFMPSYVASSIMMQYSLQLADTVGAKKKPVH